MPSAINVTVATNDRGDRLPRPQTPCPLVQPPPMRVPQPTSKPLEMMTHSGAFDSSGMGWPINQWVAKPPMARPAKNSKRQPLSGPASEPQAIPLIPAIRPMEKSNQMADKPSSKPPVRGNVKLSICDLAIEKGLAARLAEIWRRYQLSSAVTSKRFLRRFPRVAGVVRLVELPA